MKEEDRERDDKTFQIWGYKIVENEIKKTISEENKELGGRSLYTLLTRDFLKNEK